MAGDQGIANAYAQYFNAQAQDKLQSDPFYVATQIATQAAQEWTFEKKKDEERAKKKGEAYQDNIDEMFTVAADGYNNQGKELMHSTMASFADQMNVAVKSGDKKAMSRIMMDARTVASEFQRGQKLLKEHSTSLADGSYSKGAGTATLNKFLAGGEQDYKIYMETDPQKPNYLKPYFQIKGNNANPDLLSFDELDKGNVKRADEFGGGYDKLIKEMVKQSTSTGVYEFDEGQVERLLDKQLANNDVMYSAYHDNIFGDGTSIKEDRAAANKAKGKTVNESWEYMWNDDIPPNPDVVMGNSFQNSGYDPDAMRGIVKQELMKKARKEYNMRFNAYQTKVQADEDKKNSKDPDQFQVGVYTAESGYQQKITMPTSVVKTVASNIKNKQTVVFENQVWKPDGDGWVRDSSGDRPELKVPDVKTLIYTLDANRGYIRNSPIFTNLFPPDPI